MANISSLEQLVRPFVLDCPKFVVNAHLTRAARGFCSQTHAWKETYSVTVLAGETEAIIPLPATASMINVVSVKSPDRYLGKAGDKSWLCDTPGTPLNYAVTALNGFAVGPIPKVDTALEVVVTLQPALMSDEVSDFIVEAWGEGIADGAVNTLLMMRDTPWYEPGQAAYHGEMFKQATNDAKNRISVGFQSGNARVAGGLFI